MSVIFTVFPASVCFVIILLPFFAAKKVISKQLFAVLFVSFCTVLAAFFVSLGMYASVLSGTMVFTLLYPLMHLLSDARKRCLEVRSESYAVVVSDFASGRGSILAGGRVHEAVSMPNDCLCHGDIVRIVFVNEKLCFVGRA